MQTVYYDPNKCMSIRARYQNIQCCYDKKTNSDYCGIHTRSQHIVRIDSILGAQPMAAQVAVPEIVRDIIFENIMEEELVAPPILPEQSVEPIIKKRKPASKQKKDDIYTYHDIRQKIRINNDKLERSCEFYGITYEAEAPRDSYKVLKRLIIKRIEPYLSHEGSIIAIQRVFKGWNIRRRRNCNNKEDCGTMDVLYEIPIQYYIDYKDEEDFTYGFDIRSLHIIMSEATPINPFTQKKFDLQNGFFEKYTKKMNAVKEKEGVVKFDSPKLTKDQRFNQVLVRVFQKIDMLGHYTDIAWFQNMTLRDLNYFYKGAYDIFAFRAQLSHEVRRKIVRDGILFQNFIGNLHNIHERTKHILQYEILREIERILDEGEDRDSKILGITLILTVLVECSHAAAMALPHLVQSSFD